MTKRNKIVLSLLFIAMFIFCTGALVYSYNLKTEKENLINKYQNLILASDTEFLDYKNGDGIIKSAILYQEKNNPIEHGIGIIVDNQCYKIGVYSQLKESMDKNSKIISIEDNEVIFNSTFNNQTYKFKVILTKNGSDIHFKLIDL